ncbi:MAG: uncharacterized protein CEN90_91 [Parcubacteria group bacterium Licking1014_17]|nr:MAG: uncharacterized protein CEN90_91 [Parcubacteria group bacterium Licking1014_17]
MVGGGVVGYLLNLFFTNKKISSAKAKADEVLNDAKSRAQDILLESKQSAIKIHEDSKKEAQERQQQLSRIEQILTKREAEVEAKVEEIKRDKRAVVVKMEELEKIKKELDANRHKQIEILEKIASITKEEAQKRLFANLEEEYKQELQEKMMKMEGSNFEELERKAKEIMTMTIQRYASSQISDATTTVVSLPSDEIKGKIIGKEGRNIKTIERLTGVDIIIDDTPETLVVSGFDPIRRQIARLAIEKLIVDGRIHPAKIEEMVEKAKSEINEKIKQAGEAALFEVGIGAVDPKLTHLLGRLAFRTSFGQNVLLHSIEMAHIAGMLAAELGVDVMTTKKAALFHDIGKAVDHEVQGTHTEIGRKILEKFNLDGKIIKAMESHHEEYPYTSLESRIIQAADAISSARPGARRDSVEIYLKRLADLENIANNFEGVERSYAIQAGRELRIFVTPSNISDLSALKLAKDIAKKIESELKYPGEIKVVVIRETRAIEYAK